MCMCIWSNKGRKEAKGKTRLSQMIERGEWGEGKAAAHLFQVENQELAVDGPR
jgi:hypothetical protein